MKGLLIKDFRQILTQKNALVIFVALGLFFLFTRSDISFAISYTVFMFAIYFMSVISYDQQDNGMAFLMTLPISRKDYVKEKYIFILFGAALVGVLYTIIGIVVTLFRNPSQELKEIILFAIVIILLVLVFLSLLLPIEIKYGMEKARIVMFLFAGGIVAAVFVLDKIQKQFSINLDEIGNKIFSLDKTILGVIAIVASMGMIMVSYFISVKVMEKKEF